MVNRRILGSRPRTLKSKQFKKVSWRKVIAALIITGLVALAWHFLSGKTNQAILLRNLTVKQTELDSKLTELNKSKLDTKQLQDEKTKLELEKAQLQKDLQAKKDNTDKVYAESLQASVSVSLPKVVSGCGDNQYAQFIYEHESGCNLNAVNSIGCRGIGQSCPGSKLPCGADYACQNAWFTNYANLRYGGWSGAYSFWTAHHYW